MDKLRVSRKSVVLKFVIPYFIFFVLICIPIYLVYYNSYKQNFIYDVSYMMEDVSSNILEWISEYSVKVDAAENFIKSDLFEEVYDKELDKYYLLVKETHLFSTLLLEYRESKIHISYEYEINK